MVEIEEKMGGFEVRAITYCEIFGSKFKAIMAAHAVAMKQAVQMGQPVSVMAPMGWGEAIIIRPN